MKKLVSLILIGIVSLFLACTNNTKDRNYTYIETIRVNDIWGGTEIKEEPEMIIVAAADSSAYIEAFTTFCISQKVNNDMRKKGLGEYTDVPISFKLYNDIGEDITNIEFATKKIREEEIFARLVSMGNVVDGNISRHGNYSSTIDSVKIKDLLPYFDVKKDEFDPSGKIWYTPKSAPKFSNRNGIYLYFAVIDNKVQTLRFRVQYYADDWLFFKKVQFSIDDKAYEFIPMDTETDHGNGMIWEWFDESLTGSDRELIYALSDAKYAKIKFLGRQYYDIEDITQKQITDIKRTLELYKAMGGTY